MSTERIQGSLTMLSIHKHTCLDIIYIYVFLVIDWRLEMRGVVMKRMLMLN
jgi:hypothetical protein